MSRSNNSIDRIESVLDYIHHHLEKPLSVEELAHRFHWSRWQLQRVFNAQTGQSVAYYVRTLRLSRAAEALISTDMRQLDIALACGFDSEISFCRAFKQHFGCTAGDYRRRGLRSGLKTPIRRGTGPLPPEELNTRLLQIGVETREAFTIVGLSGQISGLSSPQPDFATKVPLLWHNFLATLPLQPERSRLGVLEVSRSADNGRSFPYWAGIETDPSLDHNGLQVLRVPSQQYAVIPVQGPITALEKTLNWFISYWLPDSGYQGCYGYDLEVYHSGFQLDTDQVEMEYWVPIRRKFNSPSPISLSL